MMKEKWSSTGGVLSAFFSSVCCIGPLIFSALGAGAGATGFLGASARFAASITPYRLLFVLLTFGCNSIKGRKVPPWFHHTSPSYGFSWLFL